MVLNSTIKEIGNQMNVEGFWLMSAMQEKDIKWHQEEMVQLLLKFTQSILEKIHTINVESHLMISLKTVLVFPNLTVVGKLQEVR